MNTAVWLISRYWLPALLCRVLYNHPLTRLGGLRVGEAVLGQSNLLAGSRAGARSATRSLSALEPWLTLPKLPNSSVRARVMGTPLAFAMLLRWAAVVLVALSGLAAAGTVGAEPKKCSCKHLEQLAKEISDNEYLKQEYAKKAADFRSKIADVKKLRGQYSNLVAMRHHDELEEWTKALQQSFKKERNFKELIIVHTDPNDPSKPNPKDLERVRKTTACSEIYDSVKAHEDYHSEVSKKIKEHNRAPTAEDVANEEVEAYGKGLEVLRRTHEKLSKDCNKRVQISFSGVTLVAKGPGGPQLTMNFSGKMCGDPSEGLLRGRIVEHFTYGTPGHVHKFEGYNHCVVPGSDVARIKEQSTPFGKWYCIYTPGSPSTITIRVPSGVVPPNNRVDPPSQTVEAIEERMEGECPPLTPAPTSPKTPPIPVS